MAEQVNLVLVGAWDWPGGLDASTRPLDEIAAQIVTRGFELDDDQALAVLAEWNQRCLPPWPERELKRKLQEALKRGRMPFGAMLERGAL